jgi:hypothetical protein
LKKHLGEIDAIKFALHASLTDFPKVTVEEIWAFLMKENAFDTGVEEISHHSSRQGIVLSGISQSLLKEGILDDDDFSEINICTFL